MYTPRYPSAWIVSARFDVTWFFAPALCALVVACVLHALNALPTTMPLWVWVVLVLGVDVAHVYSTLFRTYFSPKEFNARRTVYVAVPIVAWLFCIGIYQLGDMWFWRILAYIAVFHFVRQQYGFMMLYRRSEPLLLSAQLNRIDRWLDKGLIYTSMLYPLAYWHSHARAFAWFVEGDFLTGLSPYVATVLGWVYVGMWVLFSAKSVWQYIVYAYVNIPKQLMMISTALIWWVGIVYYNHDISFTLTNVLAHGIPYMALIWVYQRRALAHEATRARTFATAHPPVQLNLLPKQVVWALLCFVAVVVLCAALEEGLWDYFIWQEHFFAQGVSLNTVGTMIVVCTLVVPQLSHYIIDMVIWRFKHGDAEWKATLLPPTLKD